MSDGRVEIPAESLDIAVIGMAGRFPGARDIREFWRNIAAGVESITFFTDEELARAGVAPELLAHPDYVKAAPVLAGIEQFDAPFFGYSPREAAILDPQQRLFLRAAWEALEHAGYDSETFDGAIGVFAGSSLPHYMISNLLAGRSLAASGEAFQVLIGNDKDYLTTRVSYKLNLKGPSVAVQTACSTSLVAVQLACQSLLSYQCDMALAGGVSVRVPQAAGYLRQDDMIFSPDGHCRTFDAKARGTLFGSGVGVVVLKRLADAWRDGDSIAAVVKGSAINNDGAVKIGYTAPSAESQAEVIASALAMAGAEPRTITCIEAHGTATQLGDPIEVSALTRVFRESTPDRGFCAIGSVKSNVGHLETAAGVAGLIKMVLALESRTLPPTLHFEEPNPQIDFASSPFYVNTQARPWETGGLPRRAGVSSFGIGGTNAHVVLEEAPEVAPGDPGKPWNLLVWSARTEPALDRMTASLAAWLAENPAADPADVAATLQLGRRAFACRRMAVCRDLEDARRVLETLDPERVFSSYQTGRDRPVAFLFSGQGAQYPGMGGELYELEPVYREEIDRCCERLRPHLGFDLRQALYPEPAAAAEAARRLEQTAVTQPALFVTEYALARLLASWGIEPQALIGHSIGEYVAACLAGVFPLDDALRLVAERGRLMQGLPGGSMLSVPLPAADVEPLLGGTGLTLAAVNAPDLCVVSGPDEAAAAWRERLAAERGVEARRLHTSHAFHSAMMDPILAPFAAAVRRTPLAPPRIPFVSNLTGTWITAEEATSPDYWARHLRQPVRFAAGAAELLADSGRNLLEVGPGRTLVTFARRQMAPGEERGVLATMRHPGDEVPDLAFLYTALGRLWLAGSRPDWRALHGAARRRRLPLPTYPFEERRYWIEARPADGAPGALEIAFEAGAGEADPRAGLRSSYVEPRNDLERRIAAIWQRKLGVARVGAHDNFFELGGHSLLATQVQAEINRLFETHVALRQLFEKPTVTGVAAVLEELGVSAPAAVEAPVSGLPVVVADPASRYAPFPMTDMQQAQWIGRISAFNMGNVAAHVYFEAESRDLDLERLEGAWQRMVERHEMLRAVVLPDGRQQILREVPPYLFETLDLRGMPAAEAERRLLAVRERMSHQVRPADKWPLFEIRASRLGDAAAAGDARLRLHLSFDLMICDVASLRILFAEWHDLYERPEAPLPALDLSFRDYVLAEQQIHDTELYRRSLDYWRRRIPDLPPAPQLPLVKSPGDLTRPRFARWSHLLDAASWQRLKARAAQMGLSGSAVVLAAYAELLAAWSRSPRFCVNSTIINRLPLHPQVHEVIGEFASFAPTAVETPARFTFVELARNLQEQSWQDLEHRYVSGVRILREMARLHGGTEGATLPVVLTSTLVHSHAAHEPGLAAWLGDMVYAISQTPQVWLDHSVFEDSRGLLISWHAAVELFPDGMLDDMWSSYVRLFHRLADEEEIWHRRTLDLTPAAHLEQRRLANATDAPVSGALLHTLFDERAALQPERPAVVAPGRTLSYGELARRSRQLGRRLRGLGVGPNQLVAVVMEKGWEQVVAVLGVLAAGGAYVGIEAGVPEERLRYLLEHSQAAMVLTQPGLQATLPWPDGVRVLALDAGLADLDGLDDSPLAPVQGPDDLAYVIYTSGSTGLPKGVVISHRGAVSTILDVNERFGVGPEDRVLALSSLAFDLSVYDIFGLLAAGGAIVLPQPGARRDPEHWLDLAVREGVTLWNSVPALMEIFVEYAANRSGVPPLRLVLMSGDWIPVTLPGRLRKLFEGVQVISLGGATEASIWSIDYPIAEVDPAWDSIPYGKPLRNQRFHVLDAALEPCPVWVPGDLYIGGVGLALGYWRDEARTQASFFVHPGTGERLYRTGDLGRYLPDGNIEFLGREDFQVKILGHRIELGEIEATLLQHRAVRAAVVHARGEQRGKKRLAAYVVPEAGAEVEAAELRRHLFDRLPDYMVPADFVLLDELPLTANGKVDRNALPDPERAGSGTAEGAEDEVPLSGPVEEMVRIFAEVLGTEQVGIHDNFFELGGDSIIGIQLVNRLNEHGLHITPQQLFEHQTIAGLAAVAAASPGGSAEQGLVTGPVPLTPFERRFLDEHPEPGAAAQWVVVELAEGVDPVLLSRAVQQLITHHDALRLRLEEAGGAWRQAGAPDEQAVHLARVRLAPDDATEAGEEALGRLRQELIGRLDLARGPLVAGAHVDRGDSGPRLLVLVAHPLAVDVPSWRLLLQDLETAYGKLDRGEPVELPAKTVSFKRWAESLAERAGSPEVQDEAACWLDDARARIRPPGLAGPDAVPPGDLRSLTVTLGEEDTRALLGEALRPYNNQLAELLLTALVAAAGRFTGADALWVDHQVCGRDADAGELDLGRTVGCFTTAAPLLLDLTGIEGLGERLQAVKEQVRAMPRRGLGYGLLRYGEPGSEVAGRLSALPRPEIAFQDLGDRDGLVPPGRVCRGVLEASVFATDPLAGHGGLLRVSSHVAGGRLTLVWSFPAVLQAVAEPLSRACLEALQTLVAHCLSPEVGGFTPSDFPDAGLSQSELDRFLDFFSSSDGR